MPINARSLIWIYGKLIVFNLISFLKEITSLLDKENYIDAIYLVLYKEFNLRLHNIFIKKSQPVKIHKAYIKWIMNFLTDRS